MLNCILIDDEKWVGIDIQKSVHWMDHGFNPPIFYQSPKLALEKMIAQAPDVVFTDIRIPEMSGIDLIQELRKRNIDSEIVILSAYEDFEVAKYALRLNVVDYCLKPINVSQIESLLESLAEKVRAKRKSADGNVLQKKECSATVQKVIQFLEENLDKKVTLGDAADQIFLNKNYLCSIFHEETGKSFSEYMTDLRMKKAKSLLEETSLPIPKIAETLSYCDHFYFTKVFKKKVGISPYAYRKSEKKP